MMMILNAALRRPPSDLVVRSAGPAFATAERNTFSTTFAAECGVNFSMVKACDTCCPRIISMTGLAFRGATRTNRRIAFASAIGRTQEVAETSCNASASEWFG